MNENGYKCDNCGNDKYFYYEVTVPARQKFNAKTGKEVGKPYKIDKGNIDETFQIIYCCDCEEIVADESGWGD